LQQYFEQPQFPRRQFQHLLADVGNAADLVEGQRAMLDDGRPPPAPRRVSARTRASSSERAKGLAM
jgi:hypothetical protein